MLQYKMDCISLDFVGICARGRVVKQMQNASYIDLYVNLGCAHNRRSNELEMVKIKMTFRQVAQKSLHIFV